MTRAAISLGSNVGDRRRHLAAARQRLEELGTVVAVSPVYRTEPIGVTGHPDYLNAVAVIDTELGPGELLDGLLRIEADAGRSRATSPEPRPIDLDLVLYGSRHVREPGLEVPHPRMHERRFVLEPLRDVWPDAPVPGGLDTRLAAIGGQRVEPADRGAGWVAAQAVLALLLLVAAIWDAGSLGWSGSWFRWVGRVLVVAGAVQGVLGLRGLGRQLTAFPEPLATGRLVDTGIYGAVRHPLYGANTLVLAGLALHQHSRWAVVVAVVSAAFYYAKAVAEERRLAFRYPGYQAYQRRVRARLVPFLL